MALTERLTTEPPEAQELSVWLLVPSAAVQAVHTPRSFHDTRPPTSPLIILCASKLSVTLSDCLSVGKREMQNFRVGKDLLTDRHHINIYVAGPFYVPGMTLDVVEANRSKSLPCPKCS